jgi:hypothetical protein
MSSRVDSLSSTISVFFDGISDFYGVLMNSSQEYTEVLSVISLRMIGRAEKKKEP